MIKPTAHQVKEYADSIDYEIDAEQFIDHYDMIGWMYGTGRNRKPIVSWQAAVRTWKRRDAKSQRAVQSEVGGTVKPPPPFEPTVFVQCVKGPTAGRYMPVILSRSHLEDIPNERYILAAEDMCQKLSVNDGTEWIVRADVDERVLMAERTAASADKVDRTQPRRKRGPLGINKELYEQIKKLKSGEV